MRWSWLLLVVGCSSANDNAGPGGAGALASSKGGAGSSGAPAVEREDGGSVGQAGNGGALGGRAGSVSRAGGSPSESGRSGSPIGGGVGGTPREGAGGVAGVTAASGSTSSGGESGGSRVDCAEARLSVMTFNIRYDSGSGQGAWSSGSNPRRERVIDTIEQVAPDVLGVQEALARQVDDLKAGLPAYEFFGVGRDDGMTRGEYAGIFYRRDRLTRLDGGHFWLSTTPDEPGTVFSGSGSIRMATWVVLEDSVTSERFFVLNTHWDNVSESSRGSSGGLIRDRVTELAPELPRIITGDFNESSEGAGAQALLSSNAAPDARLFDAYREVHPEVAPDERTFHDFSGDTRGVRIDFILHNRAFEALDASIEHTSFDGLYPSDHFPVKAVLVPAGACSD